MKSYSSRAAKRLAVLKQLHDSGDLLLFLRILVFATAVPILLRLKLPQLESLLEARGTHPTPVQGDGQEITRYVEAAIQLGKPLIRPTCLTRALTRYYFFRRVGLEVALCFGVGNVEGQIAGHCWLLKDGQPFLEVKDPSSFFVPILTFPTTKEGENETASPIPAKLFMQ